MSPVSPPSSSVAMSRLVIHPARWALVYCTAFIIRCDERDYYYYNTTFTIRCDEKDYCYCDTTRVSSSSTAMRWNFIITMVLPSRSLSVAGKGSSSSFSASVTRIYTFLSLFHTCHGVTVSSITALLLVQLCVFIFVQLHSAVAVYYSYDYYFRFSCHGPPTGCLSLLC